MIRTRNDVIEKGSVRSANRRRRLLASGVLALVAAVGLTLVPAAFNSSTPNGLSAYVVASNRGPLPAGGNVRHFVHVINSNDFGPGPLGTRHTLANAFVLDSIDLTTLFNGAQVGDPFTIVAPPNAIDFAGRWPTTVTVDFTTTPPSCCVVGKPAIIPGENTVAFYVGQPLDLGSGKYVFQYTLHGKLNGDPVDLSATSPQVNATD